MLLGLTFLRPSCALAIAQADCAQVSTSKAVASDVTDTQRDEQVHCTELNPSSVTLPVGSSMTVVEGAATKASPPKKKKKKRKKKVTSSSTSPSVSPFNRSNGQDSISHGKEELYVWTMDRERGMSSFNSFFMALRAINIHL